MHGFDSPLMRSIRYPTRFDDNVLPEYKSTIRRRLCGVKNVEFLWIGQDNGHLI